MGQTVDQPAANGQLPTGSSLPHPTISNQTVGLSLDHSQGPNEQIMDHPPCSGPIIKNIPKAARSACCSQMSNLLQKVLKDPNDLDCWSNLLSFGPTLLTKPPRAGKKHNIANQIIKRCGTNRDNLVPSSNSGTDPPRTFRGGDIGSLVASKIEDGNLRAAVRILISDESLAPFTMDTATKLQAKHPQANPNRGSIAFPIDFAPLRISEADVKTAMSSFPAGSAGGPDGLRPNHMSQLLKLKDFFEPIQLGAGAKGGCEAAVHATRQFTMSIPNNHVLVKLDFKNAFNSVHRDTILEMVAKEIPELYPYCYLAYGARSSLKFGETIIWSEEGVQQGDPLGPILFCLAIHPIFLLLSATLRVGYMDDITLGGDIARVKEDVELIHSKGSDISLNLNPSKCELIYSSTLDAGAPSARLHDAGSTDGPEVDDDIIWQFPMKSVSNSCLRGAPLSAGPAMDSILEAKCRDLERALARMHLLSSQDALLILRVAFGSCRLLYVMRASNCVDHPALNEFDLLLRKGLSRITNCDISESAWLQASLPISAGGLGIRSVSMLAPSAFLASAAATRDLQDAILGYDPLLTTDGAVLSCEDAWSDLADSNPPPSEQATKQRSWGKIVVEECRARLEVSAKDQVDRARLIAVSAPHAGDWLKAMPISAFGLRLDDDSIRIAVGLRLGLPLCSSHSCPCGEQVDSRGIHGLSCRTSAGRSARHSMLNDIICRTLASAGIPSVEEPVGLGSYVDEGGVKKGSDQMV